VQNICLTKNLKGALEEVANLSPVEPYDCSLRLWKEVKSCRRAAGQLKRQVAANPHSFGQR
jgi:hypothetical protein